MRVKICGIKKLETAQTAVEAGADLLGFVFANSKRRISPEKAAEIIKELPAHVKSVGVFVNESKEEIQRIACLANLDYVQLHGHESPALCAGLKIPVIKSFSIKEEKDLNQLKDYDCAYYLLDSPGVQYAGGSGIPFNWNLLQEKHLPNDRLILAGGLTAENVQRAMAKVHPEIVDVSSGVETDGEKDASKIVEFIQTVKAYQPNKTSRSEENGSVHITR
ncbi:phosphoribosylanthranilate isomerase [Lederbergia sp. NSJ-179]|uniref:phosphoribosylanthranilate isomerase n=1 Tax=Lederbergia sp. NSJ-179 TaxID=2931402 RepID=UPI001FD33415|nr:phosphoribosylanthranilate isomerase [Lederbergia sp. NSJ-179]MCJ7842173.1 phosphoribosylanthranilate isomerase [Lederbergia sp. NSJ-179]